MLVPGGGGGVLSAPPPTTELIIVATNRLCLQSINPRMPSLSTIAMKILTIIRPNCSELALMIWRQFCNMGTLYPERYWQNLSAERQHSADNINREISANVVSHVGPFWVFD
jgi:hypothetical protein